MNREHRDWAMDAWPCAFAQAIYRILCDAFKEDRDNLIAQGVPLLDKLMTIAFFEATGFQMDNQTVHKVRRALFLRRVVKNPEQDQFEFLKGAERQQTLERQSQAVGHKPLAFASCPQDGVAMDEGQLHDVWDNRTRGMHQVGERWGTGALRNTGIVKS